MGTIPKDAKGDDWGWTVGVLKEALRIISSGAWCQGHNAKDGNGEPAFIYEEDACRWCATGAIMYAVGTDGDWPDNSHGLESFCAEYDLPLIAEAVKHGCDALADRNPDMICRGAHLDYINDELGYNVVVKTLQLAVEHAEKKYSTVYNAAKTQGGT